MQITHIRQKTSKNPESSIHYWNNHIRYDKILIISVDSMGIVPWLPFSETERRITMNTLEILTLILVLFATLTYIDNHNNHK